MTVRGKNYPLGARIDSLATERGGRPISGSDAVKDSDIRLPAGTHVILTLTQRLTLAGN